MNQNESKYYNMYVQVQRQMDAGIDKWTGVPAIVRQKNALDENIQLIKEKDQAQSGETMGVTATKNDLKYQVAQKAAIICGGLYAYASETGNLELEQASNYTANGLQRLSDNAFAQKVDAIMTLATEHMDDLADMGVTEDQITEVKTSLDDFREKIGMPRTLTINRSTASLELDELIKETTAILNNRLDRLMVRYKLTDIAFYEGYERARMLLD